MNNKRNIKFNAKIRIELIKKLKKKYALKPEYIFHWDFLLWIINKTIELTKKELENNQRG